MEKERMTYLLRSNVSRFEVFGEIDGFATVASLASSWLAEVFQEVQVLWTCSLPAW